MFYNELANKLYQLEDTLVQYDKLNLDKNLLEIKDNELNVLNELDQIILFYINNLKTLKPHYYLEILNQEINNNQYNLMNLLNLKINRLNYCKKHNLDIPEEYLISQDFLLQVKRSKPSSYFNTDQNRNIDLKNDDYLIQYGIETLTVDEVIEDYFNNSCEVCQG